MGETSDLIPAWFAACRTARHAFGTIHTSARHAFVCATCERIEERQSRANAGPWPAALTPAALFALVRRDHRRHPQPRRTIMLTFPLPPEQAMNGGQPIPIDSQAKYDALQAVMKSLYAYFGVPWSAAAEEQFDRRVLNGQTPKELMLNTLEEGIERAAP